MQALLSGLALALLSGLTVFAFNHPKAYARLYPYLITGASVVLAIVGTWQGALETAWAGLGQFINDGMVEEASRTKEQLSVPLITVVLGYVGVLAFLWGNRKLPGFVHEIERKREEHRRPGGNK